MYLKKIEIIKLLNYIISKMQRLNEIYLDPNNNDNVVLIRTINTILEKSENCFWVNEKMVEFKKLFEELEYETKIKRNDIESSI